MAGDTTSRRCAGGDAVAALGLAGYGGVFGQDRLVGYGLLRAIDDEYEELLTTIVGVLPSARGQHFGRAIMRFMVHHARGQGVDVWSTAPIDNPAAILLHDPEHWNEVNSPEPGRLRAWVARQRSFPGGSA
jgi:GNAT superfamily N-acetyltransferase